MIWLVRRIRRDFPNWERPAQISLVIALALLALAVGVVLFGPPEVRLPALIGIGGLILIAQVAVLWANRGMVTPFTQAQRHYLAEDFEAARLLLETLHHEGKADARALTLLGNTYRQLGQLDDSLRVLYEALNKAPNHHYSLYGIGRTLLSEGNYTEAAGRFSAALAAGAPDAVQIDLAEALFRAGENERALEALRGLDTKTLAQEPHRQLMARYLLYCLNAADAPDATLIRSGLPYWEATANRFAFTRYGTDLMRDTAHMRERTE